jgi:hypothetical protein
MMSHQDGVVTNSSSILFNVNLNNSTIIILAYNYIFHRIMSVLTRPSVVFAIVFACFAVLIPKVFLPLFRPKPPTPSHHFDDRRFFSNSSTLKSSLLYKGFRRPHPPPPRAENGDAIEHIPVRFFSTFEIVDK